ASGTVPVGGFFKPGEQYTIAGDFRLLSAQSGTINSDWARRIRIRFATPGGSVDVYTQASPNAAGVHRHVLTFTVPNTATSLNLRLGNGSTATTAWWDSITIEEGSTSGAYFDGDTEDGATDNESHYRWTGTPHASTSEKYLPALNIGDSDNWNIIEQYRHDGTGWVKVELSHHVFSTVDLGKATVGELDGIRISANTVGAEQLQADFGDFMVARGATLIAGIDRHRLDDSGYAIFDDSGDRRTFISPEGSTFKGEVEADTLVVNGGAELRGTSNVLAQGAKLTLAAGVTDPTAPPVVQTFWDGLELSRTVNDVVGLAFDGTNYITARRSKQLTVTAYRRNLRGYKINASSGAVTNFTCDFSSSPGS